MARLVEETHGIWNEQAEKYLLAQFGVDIRRPRNDVPGVAIISRYGTGSVGCLAANRMWRQNKIDGLAVTAMRQALNDVAFRGRVVIGEGEIDHAPMLWIGEEVGKGDGPEVDIAVDPIEGTRMVAMGQSNALAVMAFALEIACYMRPICI